MNWTYVNSAKYSCKSKVTNSDILEIEFFKLKYILKSGISIFSRKINKGEEINVNYIGLINNVHRDQRRTALLQSHKFTCFCTACDLSEEQLIVQNRLCDEFRLLEEKKIIQAMMNVRHSDKEVIYLKELYKIAKVDFS